MREELLHFIWNSGTLMKRNLQTHSGEPLHIVNSGTLNTDAGPDFFNAKIKIGTTLWAGNIEIHLKSSDWKNHKHHTDKKYNNVILHVVYHHDAEVCYENGKPIPVLELRNIIPPLMLRKYKQLQLNQNVIACENLFIIPKEPLLTNWLNRLLVERLEDKCEHINELLIQNNNNWEETFYTITARYFGMKINAQPFEWLAQNLPITVLSKHKNSLLQIEALVFGVAGFLEEPHSDNYIALMKREFDFMKSKYALEPLDKSIWKFARTRPANFPTPRLAQFAMLIYKSSHLFSRVLEAKDLPSIKNLYKIPVNEKLNSSLLHSQQSKIKNTEFGDTATELLLINSVIPLMFLYGKKLSLDDLCEKSLSLFEILAPENNAVTRFWKKLNVPVNSSFDSQALLQLKNNYCARLNCLNCIIGKEILIKNE